MKKRKIKNDLSYAVISICIISALSTTPVLASSNSSAGVKVSQESSKNKKTERREARKKYVATIRAADREHWTAITDLKNAMRDELKNATTDAERATIRAKYKVLIKDEKNKMTLAKTTAHEAYQESLDQLK